MKQLITLFAMIFLLQVYNVGQSQNTWDGSASTSWTNTANWSLNHVPTALENVIIPSTPANQPSLSGFNGVCNNLTINAGATLTISATSLNSAVLTASGNVTISGALSIGGQISTSGRLYASNITWASGSALTTYYNSRIQVSGNWEFSTGSAINMGYCDVYFNGSAHSYIISKSSNSSFSYLNINKNTDYYVYISSASTSTLKINGSLVLNAGNKLYGQADITTILMSSLTNSGNFYFSAGTVSLEQASGTQAVQVNTGDYFNSLKINGGATVTLNNDVSVLEDLTIQSGIFNPGAYTVTVSGDWINTAGPDHFIEGSGRVVFLVVINKTPGSSSGAWDNLCNYSENFNVLEVNNPYGAFVVNNAAATVTCNTYNWTAGGITVQAGTFTALNLYDNGIFGNYVLQTGGTINLTNNNDLVDLSGNVTISGGNFNVYGGTDQSYWPYNNNAYLNMSGGSLNFADQGIRVHASLTLTSNITGGTIKTAKGFSNYRSDFNPTGGTIEMVGSTDADLYCVGTAALYALKINKSLADNGSGVTNAIKTINRETGEVLADAPLTATVNMTSLIVLNGNFTLTQGTFKPNGYTIQAKRDWTNNAGAAAFVEGTGRVIFNGGNYHQYCLSDETFNILEVNKVLGGAFRINNGVTGNTVSCNEYDWTAGSVDVLEGTFSALLLTDAGIAGNFYLNDGGIINLGNGSGLTNLKGNLYIYGGTFNVNSGAVSQWPGSGNASVNMSGGVLNVSPFGIEIVDNPPYTFATNITGGIIKTQGGFDNHRSDFSPTAGTIEMYGAGDAILNMYIGNLWGLTINKAIAKTVTLGLSATVNGPLTIQSGILKATGKILSTGNNINISSGGTLFIENASQLKVTGGKVLTVSDGGTLKVLGSTGSKPIVTRNGASSYFEIQINGNISARYATFEYNHGVNIWATAIIDPLNPFDQCTFQYGVDRFMIIGNSQELTIRGANFPMAALYHNVWKNNDAGRIIFKDATGAYSGAAHESDPYNRFDWTFTQPGLWTGAVSTNWFTTGNWDDNAIPTASTNVTIPAGVPNMPVLGSGVGNCNNLTLTGSLTIGNAILQVAGSVAVNGTLAMNNAASQFIVQGDIDWNSGSSASITANNVIYIYGHWNFNAGANAQLGDGSVYFKGAANKYIKSYSATCSFWNLITNKTSMYAVEFSDLSTQPLKVNGSFTTLVNSKFISSSSQTIYIKGNILGSGVFQCNAGRVNLNGASQTITPNGSDYFNNLEFYQTGTVTIVNTYTNILNLKGGIWINSGEFNAGSNTIMVGGSWINMAGTGAFTEGSSRVIFNGPGVQTFNEGEEFNILEVNKTTGLVVINGPVVTCATYDWTSGSILSANGGIFTAYDLADDGLFGGFLVQTGGVFNLHQDVYQPLYLGASLSVEGGGAINVFGGSGWSQWPSGGNASIYMVDGTLDFKDNGISINNHISYTLTTNITGGTIRTTSGFYCNRADFNPPGGTLELYGANDVDIETYYGSLHHLTINKTLTDSPLSNTVHLISNTTINGVLTVEAGTLKATNQIITTGDDININYGGTLWLENASQLKISENKALNVNQGGFLKLLGEPLSKPMITHTGTTSSHEIHVRGTISARYAIFDYNYGLEISSLGFVDPANPLDHCTFQNSTNSSLYLDNAQDLVIRDATFNNVLYGSNVSKLLNFGHVTFKDATGAFAGAAYEYDPHNRIDWSATQPGLWTGLVSTDWHTAGNWDDLLVPTAITNVTIPTVAPRMPVIASGTAYCNNMILDGTLTIQNKTIEVGGNLTISGSLAMNDYLGALHVIGNVNWNTGSTANFTANAYIWVYGDWNFNAGSNAILSIGSVLFKGSVAKTIAISSATSSFNDVYFEKTGGAIVTYNPASTHPLRAKGFYVSMNAGFTSNCSQDIIVTGNFYSFGALTLNTGSVIFSGVDHLIIPNINNNYNSLVFNQTGSVTVNQTNTNELVLHGDLTINSGVFSPGNSILKLNGSWLNNAGTAAFDEGTGRVVFQGSHGQFCSSEQFNILEINAPTEYLYLQNEDHISCAVYDWTSGGLWIAGNATFIANDLADNGISGFIHLFDGYTELHQDIVQSVDLKGELVISGGEFKVYGGSDQSYWGQHGNASLTMSGGVLDFVDQGIAVQNVYPYSFTSSISGGTIRTQRSFIVQSPGFNPLSGSVELYGANNSAMMANTGGAFYNVTINKPGDFSTRATIWPSRVKHNFVVAEGLAEVGFGVELECWNTIEIQDGGWMAMNSATLSMKGLSSVNVNNNGAFSIYGYEGAMCHIKGITSADHYAFSILGGATLDATFAIFENLSGQGLYIAPGASINPLYSFNNCEFRNGTSVPSTLLTIDNSQDLIINDAVFPANTWGGSYNVTKNENAGQVYFINANGAFAGAAFENDPHGRIHWNAGLTATAGASPQVICAGSSAQLNVSHVGGQAPFTYLWSPATGLSDPAIIDPVASPLTTTTYQVTVTDALGLTATSQIQLTVYPVLPVSVSITAYNNPTPPGSTISLYAFPTNGGYLPEYQWKVNGIDVGTGQPVYTYQPSDGDEIVCVLTSSYACPSGNPATSNTITMLVIETNTAVSGTISSPESRCYDATNFIMVAGAQLGSFVVESGASAVMIAGVKIFYLPGTTVQPGGYMHGYITTTNAYCGSQMPAMVSVVAGEEEPPSYPILPSRMFSIYPNPTTEKFIIFNKGDIFGGTVKVEIFDLHGSNMLSTSYTGEKNHQIIMPSVSPGIYVVKVISGDLIETFKLIVSR